MNLNTYTTIKWSILSFLFLISLSKNLGAQCIPSCNNQVNISLDASGTAVVDPFSVIQGNLNSECLNELTELKMEIIGVPQTQSTHLGISISSSILNCAYTNQNISYILTYIFADGSQNSCSGNILLEDKLVPILSCQDIEITCTDSHTPISLNQIYNNAQPSTSDNCQINSLTYDDNYENYGCTNLNYLGKISRTWTATDNSGNTSTCIQNIFIEKINPANIIFPDHLDDLILPSLECSTADISPLNTGFPTLNGLEISNGNSCQLSLNYDDQIHETCGASFKIVRSWMVMDNCSNQMYNHQQIIKVADKIAPIISCSTDLTVGTSSNSCEGSIFIPEVNITDACSNYSVITETPNGIINGNGGLISNLPIGTHTITYIATDDCNNSSTCNITITITDNIPPIAICDEHTTVSLTSDGTATINATVFDDGSYDNCEITDFKVRRMATNCAPQSVFSNQITFDCCDVNNGYIMVELQVIDNTGNMNSCMIEVEVEDKIDPTIVCPSNKTIECAQNLYNFGLLGYPVATDNCPGVTVERIDNNNLDNCGLGTVTRTWTAVDVNGRSSSCVQIITIINSYPFDENDIIYPFDLTTSECGISALSPDDLSHPYAKPTLNDDACDQVAMNHEDTYLPVSGPACFKILRKWTVIDWCQFDSNASPNANGVVPGKWTYTQTIKVIDYSPPVFVSCPNNLNFENIEANCGNTFVELIVEAEDCSPNLTYTYEIDLDNNGSIDQVGNSNNASGSYPNGNHKISYTVADGCGNLGYCSSFFQIRDAKKPTPVCINGLASDLDIFGSLTIWASDFEAQSSFDNCTEYDDLVFSFSSDINHTSLTFDCSNLGEQSIELWVTDEAGNQDYCTTYIDIQDNSGACPTIQLSSISGKIHTENDIKIENVTIFLQENITQPASTSSTGNYSFIDIPQGFSYSIIPEKNTDTANGITTIDMVITSKHILGIDPLDSPYQMIAADVNNSNSITTMDVVQMRKIILGIDIEFPNNTSWRFVDANFEFENLENTLNGNFPEQITIENLTQHTIADFIAIKIGDVNGSASPNGLTSGNLRNKTGNIFFQIKNQTFKKGEEIEVVFSSQEFKDIIGYQFTIEFDPNVLKFKNVKPLLENSSKDNFNTRNNKDGKITTSWHHTYGYNKTNTEAFSLIFNALKDGALINQLSLNSSKTKAEAYYSNGELLDVNLLFENTTTQLQKRTIELFQNKPNPVINETTIGFNILNDENIEFKITDMNGRLIKKIAGNYSKGYNEIQFNKNELNTSGLLFYTLDINGKRLTKTMIIKD